ncbi:hypothetical protein [Neptuniibacter sp. QD34_54]|uniref:hypothetical protein n=1 Tax=Neptuniibacter sp. QD34_54 TaxID=3398208 RepID=UPI0039F4E8CF
MEATQSYRKPSFALPALLFIPTVSIILVSVAIAKSVLGVSSGPLLSLLGNILIVSFVTWLLTKGVFKEISRELSIEEKIRFFLLTVPSLSLFEFAVMYFLLADANISMLVFIGVTATFLNFCGVWLVISAMFHKIFKDVSGVNN